LERFHLGGVAKVVPRSIKRRLPTWTLETVDWSRTKAYFSSRGAQAVTVNLRGREPEGCVEPGEEYEAVVQEVIDVLGELVDPATGESPFAGIHRRDELYRGPLTESGPDIVLRPGRGTMAIEYFKEHTFEDVGTGWEERSSEHEREGIVILWGPGVKEGFQLADSSIEDVAPTVLHLSGAGVPLYMDGKVIEEALDDGWLQGHPIEMVGPGELVPIPTEGPTMSKEEEDLLKERLRGLGYMG
jgi:predicted AlkP superfamily phosphohydrolase/phosphomutase